MHRDLPAAGRKGAFGNWARRRDLNPRPLYPMLGVRPTQTVENRVLYPLSYAAILS